MQVPAIGMPWYKPANFLQLKTMCCDGKLFQDTYTDWLESAQKRYDRLVSQGNMVVRADIDPLAFQMWCLSRGLRMDSASRKRYAGMVAQQSIGRDLGGDTFQ